MLSPLAVECSLSAPVGSSPRWLSLSFVESSQSGRILGFTILFHYIQYLHSVEYCLCNWYSYKSRRSKHLAFRIVNPIVQLPSFKALNNHLTPILCMQHAPSITLDALPNSCTVFLLQNNKEHSYKDAGMEPCLHPTSVRRMLPQFVRIISVVPLPCRICSMLLCRTVAPRVYPILNSS